MTAEPQTPSFAHSRPGAPPEQWEPLREHLEKVARLAAEFAGDFAAAEWGRLAGLWHDVGKYSAAFQDYLAAGPGDGHRAEVVGKVDHSTAGAQHANRLGPLGRLVAYVIAGHHAGLPDSVGGAAGLSERLKKTIEPYQAAPLEILEQRLPQPPRLEAREGRSRRAFSIAFFTRMIFSCLVDADYVATEDFMAPERAATRRTGTPNIAELQARLDRYLDGLQGQDGGTEVNQRRRQVLAGCRATAKVSPGFFSLHVPTGGGKTFSSLAFALRHAARHDLRRVIYAIPFTSIIEQTATEFRKALEPFAESVLEHHSNLDPQDPEKQSARLRLAAERPRGRAHFI